MPQPKPNTAAKGPILFNGPEKTESYWQPVPANGHIDVLLAPHKVAMDWPFAMGTQTVAPGGYIREHSHENNEEALYILEGKGRAVVEGENYAMTPGTTIYLGKGNRHMFINEGETALRWVWVIIPNGLEDFFKQIGRPRHAGDKVPVNFPRPDNVLEIEKKTVFAPQPADQRQP